MRHHRRLYIPGFKEHGWKLWSCPWTEESQLRYVQIGQPVAPEAPSRPTPTCTEDPSSRESWPHHETNRKSKLSNLPLFVASFCQTQNAISTSDSEPAVLLNSWEPGARSPTAANANCWSNDGIISLALHMQMQHLRFSLEESDKKGRQYQRGRSSRVRWSHRRWPRSNHQY